MKNCFNQKSTESQILLLPVEMFSSPPSFVLSPWAPKEQYPTGFHRKTHWDLFDMKIRKVKLVCGWSVWQALVSTSTPETHLMSHCFTQWLRKQSREKLEIRIICHGALSQPLINVKHKSSITNWNFQKQSAVYGEKSQTARTLFYCLPFSQNLTHMLPTLKVQQPRRQGQGQTAPAGHTMPLAALTLCF